MHRGAGGVSLESARICLAMCGGALLAQISRRFAQLHTALSPVEARRSRPPPTYDHVGPAWSLSQAVGGRATSVLRGAQADQARHGPHQGHGGGADVFGTSRLSGRQS